MRPEVTIEARNHAEVNCLVRALSKEGHVLRVRDGFRVEVGGATPAAILSAVQACLIREGIESVSVVLKDGPQAHHVSSGLAAAHGSSTCLGLELGDQPSTRSRGRCA